MIERVCEWRQGQEVVPEVIEMRRLRCGTTKEDSIWIEHVR